MTYRGVMRAVLSREPGGPEVLEVRVLPEPTPAPGEVVIDIAASAVNRADLQQRIGVYPPPPGASDVLGWSARAPSRAVGDGGRALARRRRGVRTAGGGGYADKVAVPAGQVLPVPAGVSLVDGGGPARGRLHGVVERLHGRRASSPARRLLVHGGAGGIGTMAIQLATRSARGSPPPSAPRRSRLLPRARRRRRHQLPRRRTSSRRYATAPTVAAPTSSSTTSARSTSRATSTPSRPRAGWS